MEIEACILRVIRARYKSPYISGGPGPWGIVRTLYGDRIAVVLYASETEARQAAKESGGMAEKFSTPIPQNCPDLYPD